jgi:wyosine [tRNA(Phe)-imidazoG37] synthetase (radical SAM superfamily)
MIANLLTSAVEKKRPGNCGLNVGKRSSCVENSVGDTNCYVPCLSCWQSPETHYCLESRRNSWMASPAVANKNSAEVLSLGAGLAGDAKFLVPCRLPNWEPVLIVTLSANGSVAVESSTTLISHPSSMEARNCVKSSFFGYSWGTATTRQQPE